MQSQLVSILEDSFLKDLLNRGIHIFDYRHEKLYYHYLDKVLELNSQVKKEDAYQLIKDIAKIHNRQFDELNPYLFIKNDYLKLFSARNHAGEYISFHIDVENLTK